MRTLYKIHAWTGLVTGAFLVVICLSGAAAVFRPEIERAVDWDGTLAVQPDGQRVSMETALETVRAQYPDATIQAAGFPALGQSWYSHGETYAFWMKDDGVSRQAALDPYRNRIIATDARFEGTFGSLGNFLRQLHLRFVFGSWWGRILVGVFGVSMAVSMITGLLIYKPFNRNSWRLTLRRGRGSRILWADLHKVVGLTTLLFNLLFATTGAVLGIENINRWLGIGPAVVRHAEPAGPVEQLEPGIISQCIEQTRSRFPDAHVAWVRFSHQSEGTLKIGVEHGAAALIKELVSFAEYDASDGRLVAFYDGRDASWLGRVYYAMEPLHFGRLGGYMWVKVLWAVMGVAGGLLAISGYVIFFMRKAQSRRSRKRRRRTRSVAPVDKAASMAST